MAKGKGSRKGGKKSSFNQSAHIKQLWHQAGKLAAAGNLVEQEAVLRAILNQVPNHYGSLLELSDMALGAGKSPIALDYARRAVEANHGDAQGHHILGRVLADLGLAELAEGELIIAQQLDAEDSRVEDALGWVLTQQGRSEEAEVAYRRAIDLAPNSIGAYYNLAVNKIFLPGDPDIAAIEKLRDQEALFTQDEKAAFHFTLAKAYHDSKDFEQAFAELQQGNDLKRKQVSYHIEIQQQLTELMIKTMDADFVSRLKGLGNEAKGPIFVLGMPRSGSTLLERLLCRHPQVSSVGEVSYVNNLAHGCGQLLGSTLPYPQFLTNLSPQLSSRLGEEYVRLTRQFGVETEYVVDKMPDNFMLVGFILALLPNARIIHCTRNPVDTCLSIYQQYFTRGMIYAYSLKDIGGYYLQYRRFMDHWQTLFPDRILDVAYEDVVADSEQALRRMIKFCDLPWDDRCLQSTGREGNVRTASAWQVQQPVYSSSVRRWKHYEKHLDPLLEALKPVLTEGDY